MGGLQAKLAGPGSAARTGVAGSVSKGMEGSLAKNLKNKHIRICFQVIYDGLKTKCISCEICQV